MFVKQSQLQLFTSHRFNDAHTPAAVGKVNWSTGRLVFVALANDDKLVVSTALT